MTQQRALELYNQARGTHYNEKDLKALRQLTETINDIMEVDKLCRNLGGGLCSTQMIAVSIHFSKKHYT